jgi:hypothetical protein
VSVLACGQRSQPAVGILHVDSQPAGCDADGPRRELCRSNWSLSDHFDRQSAAHRTPRPHAIAAGADLSPVDRSTGARLGAPLLLAAVLGACAGGELTGPDGDALTVPDDLSTLDLPALDELPLDELPDPGALASPPAEVPVPATEARPADTTTSTAPPTTVGAGPVPSTPADDDPAAAAAAWTAMLTTTLPEPIAVAEPVEGPGGAPTAVSAGDRWVVVWRTTPSGWEVTQRVALADQEVAAEQAWLLGRPFDAIATDGTGDDLRFLVPTRTADGPAVAALGVVDGAWAPLPFRGVAGGPLPYAPNATLEAGRLLVWPRCRPDCDDAAAAPATVVRTEAGYEVRPG